MHLAADARSIGIVPLVLGAAAASWVVFVLGRAIYNVTLHPLASYPGPKLRGAFHFPDALGLFGGRNAFTVHALHEKYGPVVRITPRALSYTDPRVWKDVYASRPGKGQMQKARIFFSNDKFSKMPPHILLANDADHSRQRRLLAHAFSDQALRSQEDILNTYFRLLIERLREEVDGPGKGKVDMAGYYNFTTFDTIGDLAFGQPFLALDGRKYHPWIANTFQFVKATRWGRLAGQYAILRWGFRILLKYIPEVRSARENHFGYTEKVVDTRLNTETNRTDFMSYIMRHNDEKGMSREEIVANASILILAGSETTATLLSGVTYHLMRNPDKLARLQKEIRSAFDSVDGMTLTSTNQLPYLHAVIEEGLRMYPPVPESLPRLTPPEGAVIAGRFVPGNTIVGVHQYSAYRDSRNFVEPSVFAPERFLPDAPAKYAGERREVLQPFSYGPRNCIGKSLAYNEMRSILSRVMFEFDMELCPESLNWVDQKIITLWQKPPMMVQLKRHKQED